MPSLDVGIFLSLFLLRPAFTGLQPASSHARLVRAEEKGKPCQSGSGLRSGSGRGRRWDRRAPTRVLASLFPRHDLGSEETPLCCVVRSGPSERPCPHCRRPCGVSQTRRARVSAPLPGTRVRRGTQYLELELGCGPDQGCRLISEGGYGGFLCSV